MKLRYSSFSDFQNRAPAPRTVPTMVHTSSTFTAGRWNEACFLLVGNQQVSLGQRPSCLELQGDPGDFHNMDSVVLWTAPQQPDQHVQCPLHQAAAKAASLLEECLHLQISLCASQIKSLALYLTDGDV